MSKRLALTLKALLVLTINQAYSRDYCPLTDNGNAPNLMNHQLSPYWAQELIGSDLARALIESMPPDSVSPVPIGSSENIILSSIPSELLSFEIQNNLLPRTLASSSMGNAPHGTLAIMLALGPAPTGTGARGILHGTSFSLNESNYVSIKNRQIRLYNSSQIYIPFAAREEAIRSGDAVVVTASGNSFPEPMNSRPSPHFIVVGSMSPAGVASDFSQSSHLVTILAPADYGVTSSLNGEPEVFSRTSAAAPLVTGAVSNLLALLPGLSSYQVKQIVIRSAIPTLDSVQTPRINGYGMVNAYRMVQVAKRLQSGWPQSASRILDDPSLFQFENESHELWQKAAPLLRSAHSCKKRKGLDLARAAYDLKPENQEIARAISRTYREAGLRYNALFYETAYMRSLSDLQSRYTDIDDTTVKASLIRSAISYFGKPGRDFVLDRLRHSQLSYPEVLVAFQTFLTEDPQLKLMYDILNDPSVPETSKVYLIESVLDEITTHDSQVIEWCMHTSQVQSRRICYETYGSFGRSMNQLHRLVLRGIREENQTDRSLALSMLENFLERIISDVDHRDHIEAYRNVINGLIREALRSGTLNDSERDRIQRVLSILDLPRN